MNSGADAFQYGPFGRRVAKTTISGTTNYLYDGMNPVQELSGTTPTANMLTGRIDEYFTRTDSSGTGNFLTDALGNTIELTDGSGNSLAQYTYEPFGNTTATGTSSNPYQYTGRENDGNGLYFYRARYYSPTLQRFISEDPLGFRGSGPNFYAYTHSNPTNWVDPLGLNVTVTYYQGLGGNRFGHIGIAVNNNQPVGFDPCESAACDINYGPFGYPVFTPGTVDPVAPGRPVAQSVTIPTTPYQDRLIQNYINQRIANPGPYALVGRNCATFAEQALQSGGLQAPSDTMPLSLISDLEGMYNFDEVDGGGVGGAGSESGGSGGVSGW